MRVLKEIADEYGVAVLLLHHTRKATADDFLDSVSGTHGLAGAAEPCSYSPGHEHPTSQS